MQLERQDQMQKFRGGLSPPELTRIVKQGGLRSSEFP